MTTRITATIRYGGGRGRRTQFIVENWHCNECGTVWKEITLSENSQVIECPLCHATESLPELEH